MKKPTAKKIAAEAEKLKAMKPNVRRNSSFGDDHHAAIDAQIRVLTEDMSEHDIYDMEPNNEEEEEYDDLWKENEVSSALEARRWMDGEEKNPPSKDWEGLLVSR